MIPRTFPSSRAFNGSTQMIVYFLPSVSGLTRWVDYIPVKFTTVATAATENTYNQNGYIPVVSISSITGATPFKEYVPVFLDSSAVDADVWDVTITGFIPVGTAGIGGAALYLDFAATTTLDPRVTFSRTTNATLTNSAGLVANAPMNLLTFSEQFDNAAWTKSNATVTANSIAAPDGAVTADTLNYTASGSLSRALQSAAVSVSSGQVVTKSVYLKDNGQQFVQFPFLLSGSQYANFDLVNGTVTQTSASCTASISSVGNGWYRCTATATYTSSGSDYGYVWALNSGTSGFAAVTSSGSSVYVWGAQLELGSTATTYNPTTVKNLLGFTENFDNAAWTKLNASISATKVDDIYGQPFAQKLVEDTTTSGHAVVQLVGSADSFKMMAIYAKAASANRFLQLYCTGSSGYANFNLTLGTVSASSLCSASIQDIGNGWYRCAMLPTDAKNFNFVATIINSTTAARAASYTGDGTSGIYIFGAQLSDSASVDPYVYQPVAAPSSVAYYGPRFDYDPVTLAPKGLLIEEQRTNLLLNSAVLNTQVVTTTATAHTLSFYGTGTIVLSGASTGTVVGTGAYPTRTTLTFTPIVGVLTVTVTGSVTMAQLEAGAFTTSYIPTVASQVTRAADIAVIRGNDFLRWYNQTEGTFAANYEASPNAFTSYLVASNGVTAQNSVHFDNDSGNMRVVYYSGSSAVATLGLGARGTVGTVNKVASAYSANYFAASRNAGTVVTDTSGAVPVSLTQLNIGADPSGAATNVMNTRISRIVYYNRKLSPTELQGITS